MWEQKHEVSATALSGQKQWPQPGCVKCLAKGNTTKMDPSSATKEQHCRLSWNETLEGSHALNPPWRSLPPLTLPKTHLARVKHWRSPCLCFLCVSFFWCPLSIQFLNRLSWSKNMGIFMHVNTPYLAGVFSWPKINCGADCRFYFCRLLGCKASCRHALWRALAIWGVKGQLGGDARRLHLLNLHFSASVWLLFLFSQKLVSISFPAPDVDSLLGFSWGLDSWLLHSLPASQARSHWTAWVILIVARQFASSSQMRWGALCGWCRLDFSWTAPWHETAPRRGSEMRIASRVRNNKRINVPFRSFMLWYLRGLVLLAVSYISSIAK